MSQRAGITELPQDILLDLSHHLDVGDLMNLLATCRVDVFCKLHWQLHKREELGTLSLEHLRNTARRVNGVLAHVLCALEAYPQNLRPISFVFAVSHTASGVSCWDLITSRRVAYLEIQLKALSVRSRAPCMETKGKALIAATMRNESWGEFTNLVAICIMLRFHVVSPDMNNPDVPDASFFITPRVLGSTRGLHWFLGPCRKTPQFALRKVMICSAGVYRVLPFPSARIVEPVPRHPSVSRNTVGCSISSSTEPQGTSRTRDNHRHQVHALRSAAFARGISAVAHRALTWEHRRLHGVYFRPAYVAEDKLYFGPSHCSGRLGTHAVLLAVQGPGDLGVVRFSDTTSETGHRALGTCPLARKRRALGLVLGGNDGGRVDGVSREVGSG
ncbi:hypothetical protein C8R44DRAFT_881427 [Mycena epipterygia]|nr:hypothetical protein C8R44DRAFT_881427 [Mycena epipterygia]